MTWAMIIVGTMIGGILWDVGKYLLKRHKGQYRYQYRCPRERCFFSAQSNDQAGLIKVMNQHKEHHA